MAAKKKMGENWSVVENDKEPRYFPTRVKAEAYFMKRKKVVKGKLVLMTLLKKVGNKWQGVLQN